MYLTLQSFLFKLDCVFDYSFFILPLPDLIYSKVPVKALFWFELNARVFLKMVTLEECKK